LRPDISIAPERLQRLLIVKGGEQVEEACRCIVANAILAHWQGTRVHYSRDNTFYAAVRAGGAPAWFSRKSVASAVDQLVACGLLQEWRTDPSPCARYRSRLGTTPKLIDTIGLDNVSDLCRRSTPPPVILRCRADRRVLNPNAVLNEAELAELGSIAGDVQAHNQFLSAFEVTLEQDVAAALPTGFVKAGGVYLNPHARSYYRVFNGDLRHGGRWYGPFWQNVPSSLRPRLLINREPTVELDFASCQLRLMYALVDLPDPLHGQIRTSDPTFDLYSIEGMDRDVVKLAVLIMANAGSVRSARKALAAKLISESPENRSREAKRILAAVQFHFPALTPLWCSGVGLRLQRADSDLCAQVQSEMRAQGIPTLSVHDSFISWRRAEQELRAAMQKAFMKTWDDITLENCKNPP
jgi:hypothetical protein